MACKNCQSQRVMFDSEMTKDLWGRDVEIKITYCPDCGLEMHRKYTLIKKPYPPKQDKDEWKR